MVQFTFAVQLQLTWVASQVDFANYTDPGVRDVARGERKKRTREREEEEKRERDTHSSHK